MKQGFPQYSRTAKLGELGVSTVSRAISDNFGWLFKRNHQEHDFGIDGQVEIITSDGYVTGQLLAVQIKCGNSFLQERNKWGYIYRGDKKHYNYLLNYPIPVLICLCDPDTSDCYWVKFDPTAIEPTESGWKITVPFANKLVDSKSALEAVVGPIYDGIEDLKEYWKVNQLISESSVVLYVLDEHDVTFHEVAMPRAFFDGMRATQDIATKCQGKVEIVFSGYDDDPRELFEIPEVREYVAKLDRALPDLFFFARTESPTYTLAIFALCQTDVEWISDRPSDKNQRQVSYDPRPVADFVERHCPALNELTEWIGMPLEDEKRIFFSIVACLGGPLPLDATSE